MIMVVDGAKPEAIQGSEQNKLINALEGKTNLIIGIEKVIQKQYLGDNTTIKKDVKGSDIWFYAIDPDTEMILDRNSSRVQR